MWEQITQADIEQARTELNLRRAETLRRHAEEIEDLDAHLQDIERFEQVVAAFVEQYMSPETVSAVLEGGPPQSNAPPVDLHVVHQVSPGSAIPPRLRTFAG